MAIALAIVTLAILSQKKAIETITLKIQLFELQAAIKFLVITFIILPVLPNQPLSDYLTASLGSVSQYRTADSLLDIKMAKSMELSDGQKISLIDDFGCYLRTHLQLYPHAH